MDNIYEILIVDSHLHSGQMVTTMLEDSFQLKVNVTLIDNLDIASRVLKMQYFNLVIADLPVSDVRILKGFVPGIPLLAMTGPGNRQYSRRFIEAGAEYCIEKPQLTREGLVSVVERAIGRSWMRFASHDLGIEEELVAL